VMHNVGSKEKPGCVRVDSIDELGGVGFGHLRLWRAQR